VVEARFARILAAFDTSSESPALSVLPKLATPGPSLGLEG